MATKIIGEQILFRRPPYIGYAYAELNLKKTAHPDKHLLKKVIDKFQIFLCLNVFIGKRTLTILSTTH